MDPLHLLLLDEPSAHDLVDGRFNECRADSLALSPSLAKVLGNTRNGSVLQMQVLMM
jgi:hypothetical protein